MHLKTANGKQTLSITRAEWEAIGKKKGWTKIAGAPDEVVGLVDRIRSLENDVTEMHTRLWDEGAANPATLQSVDDLLGLLESAYGTALEFQGSFDNYAPPEA